MWFAAAALFLLACGGAQSTRNTGQATGSDAPDSSASAAARVVALFETLAADVQAAGADCDRIAAVLATWTEDHGNDYPELGRQARDSALPPEDGQRHRERLRSALDVVFEAASTCGDHPGAQAAFARFDLLVDPR
jgi:hypothetical protein